MWWWEVEVLVSEGGGEGREGRGRSGGSGEGGRRGKRYVEKELLAWNV